MENMIALPLTKRMEIIMGIKVCPISRMNFDYKEMMEIKLFLQIQSINIVDPNEDNMIVVPTTKRIEIVMHIKV